MSNGDEEDDNSLPAIMPTSLKPGMYIYVTTLKQKGVVLAVQGNDVTVQLGILKMNVAIANCRLASEPALRKRKLPQLVWIFPKCVMYRGKLIYGG